MAIKTYQHSINKVMHINLMYSQTAQLLWAIVLFENPVSCATGTFTYRFLLLER
jgi:hypothetical protein